MADSFKERQKKREKEEEQEDEIDFVALVKGKKTQNDSLKEASTEKLLEFMDRADRLITNLVSLYNQFFSGYEKFPPTQKRSQLDQLMVSITLMAKTSKAIRFRFINLQHKYMIHAEKWDRKMKHLEKGKIRRG